MIEKAMNGSPVPSVGDRVIFYVNKECTALSAIHLVYNVEYFIVTRVHKLNNGSYDVRLLTPDGRSADSKQFGNKVYLVIFEDEEGVNTL